MERDYRLTNARAISCIAVVILHTFASCSAFEATELQSHMSVIIRNLMFWAVPCFVMVTGALLLDPSRKVNYYKVLTRYIPRMLISLAVFTLIFKLTDIVIGKAAFGAEAFKDMLRAFITGQGQWAHMWYLYMMIALYLIIPVLKAFTDHTGRKEHLTLTFAMMILMSVLPFIMGLFDLQSGFYMPVYTIYPMYLMLGFLLINIKRDNRLVMALSIAGFIAGIIALSSLNLNAAPEEQEPLKSLINTYSFPVTVLGACGMFMLFKTMNRRIKLLDLIDQNSFGIYLIHLIPLRIFAVKQIFDPYDLGLWFVFIAAILIFAVSLIVTALIRKIPYVNKVI